MSGKDYDDRGDRSRDRSRRDRPTRFSETSRDRSPDRGGRERGGMKSSNNRVYISNIPYEYRWQDMKDLFRSEVGDVQFVELFVDDNDKPKGCGIIEFSDSGSVRKCLDVMQRFEVKGRKLVVKEDSGTQRDKHGAVVGGGGGGGKRSRDEGRSYRDDRDRYEGRHGGGGGDGGGGGGSMRHQDDVKMGNTYGLSEQFLESLGIDAPLCNRIFVANLEYNVDKKKLKEVFRLAGKVQKVEIPADKDGRSRGFAVVEYEHPVEAVQAISMLHNQVLYDRLMTVRMDRAVDPFRLPDGLKSVGMGLGTNGEPLKNVSQNLPQQQQQATVVAAAPSVAGGGGLLGMAPNSALQVANALSSLANPSSVLQAANLSSLLGGAGALAAQDLSAGFGQASQQHGGNNNGQGGGGGGMHQQQQHQQQFGGSGGGGSRSDSGGSQFGGQGQGYQGYQTVQQPNRGYSTFDSQQKSPYGGGGGGGGGGGDMMRSPSHEKTSPFTRKLMTSSLFAGAKSVPDYNGYSSF